jgi:hypothetical protein
VIGGMHMINKNFYKAFNAGWNDLFEELLKELEQYDVEIAEAKEKYGTLNVYAYSENNNEEVQNIINKYEEQSKHVCEMCGSKGTITTEHGWMNVLCEGCMKAVEK